MTTRLPAWFPGQCLLIAALLLVLPACGDDRPPPPGAASGRPLPSLPPVSADERARFALDRLLRGPLPRTAAFAIPGLHRYNLIYARRDLVGLPAPTMKLLRDVDLIEDLTRPLPTGHARNGWHGVLDVLVGLPAPSAELALAWTEPALDTRDLPLQRRAVRVLARLRDERAGPPLVGFLARRGGDNDLAMNALVGLAALGSPWLQKGLQTTFESGGRTVWDRVPTVLVPAPDRAAGRPPTPAALDALAWWNLLAETGGPEPASPNARVLTAPWTGLGAEAAGVLWPPRGPTQADRVLMADADAVPSGLIPASPSASAVVPWREWLTEGRSSAALARCALAGQGYGIYEHSVRRDEADGDSLLAFVAEACVALGPRPGEAERSERSIDDFLAALDRGESPAVGELPVQLRRLQVVRPEPARAGAEAILARARPFAAYETLLKSAAGVLRKADPEELLSRVSALALSDRPEDRLVALGLMRVSPDARYAEPLEKSLAGAPPDSYRLGRSVVIGLYAREGVEPAAQAAFVGRFVRWIEEAPDSEAAGLIAGLADLGPEGAAALARGLRGPRRHLYAQALLGRTQLLPLTVAEALLDPLDAATPPDERRTVIVAAYHVAPTEAAPHVAAARRRLPAEVQPELDDVLEVLRHRAE